MKKNYLSYALMALALPLVIACDEENKVVPFNPDTTAPNGILVLNSGNQGKAIDGSLHFIKDNTVTNDVFKGVNQTSLGGTPNDMIVYGSKIYIVSTLENTVFVLDKNTRKLLQRVNTTDLMGKSEGQSPRQLAAGDGQVFVSAYSTGGSTPYSADLRGHVAAFDTINFVKTNSVEVGSYPEGLDYDSSGKWSDKVSIEEKKTAEHFVYLNNHKQIYKNEQQFSISCMGALQP